MTTPLAFPKYLSIQTTSLCNSHCSFCPYDELKGQFAPQVMDEALFRRIIDECSGQKGIERIILYLNNEPLTDPSIVERINYAKEKVPWASLHLLTNGSLLNAALAQKLIDSRLDWIGISFHGIRKETIERGMGIPYETTLARILDFIASAGKKKDLKDFVMITFLKHAALSDEEASEAVAFWKNRGIERISYFDAPISRAGNVTRLPQVRHGAVNGCASIWANEMVHIVENGDVVLCCMDWKREVPLGNVRKMSIAEVWHSPEYEAVRLMRDGVRESPEDFICKRCEAAVLPSTLQESPRRADIALALCPVWGVNMPPLGLATIASDLKTHKLTPALFDFNIDIYNEADPSLRKFWEMSFSECWDDPKLFARMKELFSAHIERCADTLCAVETPVVGFSVYASNRFFSIEVMKRLKSKAPQKLIVAGGRGTATPHERDIFPAGTVDYFLVGEGEVLLRTFLNRVAQGKVGTSPDEGILSFTDRKSTAALSVNSDLAAVASPSYEEFDLKKYQEKSLAVVLSRGCISHCAFCDDWRLIGSCRSRDAIAVADEIEHHVRAYGITYFYFNDPAINAWPQELERLCDELIRRRLAITWIALAIPGRFMNARILEKMRRAGCITLNYGVESGSDRVLKLMGKMFATNDVIQVLKDTRASGINTQLNFIAGFPGETEDDFQETLRFVREHKALICGVTNLNTCNAVRGASLSLEAEKFGILFPPDDLLRDSRWYTADGNTYEVRKKRAVALLTLLKELNIPLFTSNVYAKDPSKAGEVSAVIADSAARQVPAPQEKALRRLTEGRDLDVLLVTLPPWGVENPPIGLGYLDAYCQAHGFTSSTYDLNIIFFHSVADEFKMLWHVENKNYWSDEKTFPLIMKLFERPIEDAVATIAASGAPLVGFSVVDPKERITVEVIKRLKERSPGTTVILGGPACSTEEQRKFFLDRVPEAIEYFVVGEGEKTLFQILQTRRKSFSEKALTGLVLRRKKGWEYVAAPSSRVPLDEVGFPTYASFDIADYTSGGKTVLVEWSRGCLGKCSFCKNYRLSGHYRSKSASLVLKELRYLVDTYGIREFTVCDNLLNGDIAQLDAICTALVQDDLRISWTGQIAPRKEMTEEIFEKMYKAGCHKIQIGVESGCDKVLQAMRKIYTSQTAQDTLRAAKKAGLETEIFVIIGFPGESEEDFLQTCDFVKRNADSIDTIKSINTLHLIAGTDVYDRAQEFGLKPLPERDWHYLWESSDGNTYPVRKKRAERLLALASAEGIRVMETNIMEGKQSERPACTGTIEEQLAELKRQLTDLQPLPPAGRTRGRKASAVKKSHNPVQFILLFFLFVYTLFYITYFWVYKKIHGKSLLGGD